jgi:hypothetical protein
MALHFEEYFIHDNGGRPFLTKIYEKKVYIFTIPNYDKNKTIEMEMLDKNIICKRLL